MAANIARPQVGGSSWPPVAVACILPDGGILQEGSNSPEVRLLAVKGSMGTSSRRVNGCSVCRNPVRSLYWRRAHSLLSCCTMLLQAWP
jgi:hypothetical protein